MATVLIRGDGVAARCCARLLHQAGLAIAIEAVDRPKVPVVMVGWATQKLLSDVFEREDLFAGLPLVERRVVAWGEGGQPASIPHSAVIVSEQSLLERIGPP